MVGGRVTCTASFMLCSLVLCLLWSDARARLLLPHVYAVCKHVKVGLVQSSCYSLYARQCICIMQGACNRCSRAHSRLGGKAKREQMHIKTSREQSHQPSSDCACDQPPHPGRQRLLIYDVIPILCVVHQGGVTLACESGRARCLHAMSEHVYACDPSKLT